LPVRSREAKEGENPERRRLVLSEVEVSRTNLSAEVLTKADDNFPDSSAIEDPRFCKFASLTQNRDKFFFALSEAEGFGGNSSINSIFKKL